MNDQISGAGMPEVPDGDVDISNKGQRITVILVAILILAAGIGGFVYYSKKQAQIAALDKLKSDFADQDVNGYIRFWKQARLDLDTMKTNTDFHAKITEYLEVSSIAYANHVKEKALPVLEESIPRYKALEAAGLLHPELQDVHLAITDLLDIWKDFVKKISLYEGYLKNRSNLTEIANQWASAQAQPKEEKFKEDAAKYVSLLNCIFSNSPDFKDKSVLTIDPVDLSYRVRDTCAKVADQANWFENVAFFCLDKLSQEPIIDAVYEETLNKYSEEKLMDQDTKSLFAVNHCLDLTRKTFEEELSNTIAKAWVNYASAKNALLKAIDEAKKDI